MVRIKKILEKTGILDKLKSQATVIRNFSFLSILQVFNLVLPFITYPYLISILGLTNYGEVIYAQVIMSFFSLFIDFGFRVSATRDISIHRENNFELSKIVSSVYILKLIMWITSLLILSSYIYIAQVIDYKLYFFAFMLCFNEFLFPQWFFQGIEKMKFITIINISVRLVFVVLIFIFIKETSDYLLVPLFYGIGALIGGLTGVLILFLKYNIRFIKPSYYDLREHFNKSSILFLSNAIIAVKDKFSVFFIGSSLGMSEVAMFDFFIKIMNIFFQPIDSINAAIYPKMAKEKNMKYLYKVTKIVFVVMLIGIILIQPFLSPIITFIDLAFVENINVLRILLISPLIMVWSLALARNCILVNQKNKLFTLGMLFTSLFYLILIGGAYLLKVDHNIFTFAIITVLVYSFELYYRVYVIKKNKLFL